MTKANVYIRLFFDDDVKKPSSKNKIKNNVIKLINSSEIFSLKSQDNILLSFEYAIFEWEKLIFYLIILSQKLAYAWTLTSDIHFDFSTFSNKTKICGLHAIGIECRNSLDDLDAGQF